MSLTINALQPLGAISTSGYPKRYYVVDYKDLQAGGAFTTVDIILDTFPPATDLVTSRIKHTTSVAGTSFSASTARIAYGASGALTLAGTGALDVFAAVGTTEGTHSINQTTIVPGDTEASNLLVMRVTSTGGNLSAATAGEIHASVSTQRNSVI
jgi:hypothetical protein